MKVFSNRSAKKYNIKRKDNKLVIIVSDRRCPCCGHKY